MGDKWPESVGPCSRRLDYQHPVLSRSRVGMEVVWSLVRQFREGSIVIPDYQRARVWSDEQSAAFVGFVLEGGRCPAMYIREVDTPNGPRDELVDGQQRLTAFIRWENGEIPGVLPSRNRALWVADAPHQKIDMMLSAPVARFSGTRDEAILLYIAVNNGGTPHTAAEIEAARSLLGTPQS